MNTLMSKFKSYSKDESGATMIEYALIGALISIAAISVLPNIGGDIKDTFNRMNDALDDGLANAGTAGSVGGGNGGN